MVIGMFFIAKTGDNPNVINYEVAIQDKYAAWEQDLTERESVIREKELELGVRWSEPDVNESEFDEKELEPGVNNG